MNRKRDEDGWVRLAIAIYETAARDYKQSLLSAKKRGDRNMIDKRAESFLLSGAYGFDPEVGAVIVEKIKKEVGWG